MGLSFLNQRGLQGPRVHRSAGRGTRTNEKDLCKMQKAKHPLLGEACFSVLSYFIQWVQYIYILDPKKISSKRNNSFDSRTLGNIGSSQCGHQCSDAWTKMVWWDLWGFGVVLVWSSYGFLMVSTVKMDRVFRWNMLSRLGFGASKKKRRDVHIEVCPI